MTPIKLRNKSKLRPVLICRKADRDDGAIVPLVDVCPPNKVATFDGDNPSVRIYAKAGELVATDAESKSWFAGLKV